MYQILIVEDEPEAANLLERHLERYATEHAESFSVTQLRSAEEFASQRREADLVFMDIEMGGMNGMEATALMRAYDSATPVIFVTNLARYAVRGYEVDALDFIVKPVSYYNFSLRMDRAMRQLKRDSERKLVLSTKDGMRIVPTSDLVFVEVMNHDLTYHVAGSEGTARVRGSLSKVEEELAGGTFLRISSGCIINMAHVRTVEGDAVRMDTGDVLYPSRAKRRASLEALADYFGGTI